MNKLGVHYDTLKIRQPKSFSTNNADLVADNALLYSGQLYR